MKNLLSKKKTTIILSVVVIISLFFYAYMLTKPISYGLSYYHASMYEGDEFSGSMIFYEDNTMLNRNTNFDEDMVYRYYYKDGYLFFTLSETEEEYQAEVASINADFEAAINTPFYAAKINAFRLSAPGVEGDASVYFCKYAVVFAVACGAVELALICLICVSFARHKKAKNEQS